MAITHHLNSKTNKVLNQYDLNNKKLSQSQKQASTGKRINSVADDPAGYTLSEKLKLRTGSLRKSFDNASYAKNVLYVAESGYSAINDVLGQIKEKIIQSGNASYSNDERKAILQEVNQLKESISDIQKTTKFNNQDLIGDNGLNGVFQVGADEGDELSVDLRQSVDPASLNLDNITLNDLNAENLGGLLGRIDSSIDTISSKLQYVGATINRFEVKEVNISQAITNTDAAKSRILDADLAKVQSEIIQQQILQNVSTAQLAQANISANNVSNL
jgi:flagellin